jgi:nitrogen fixation/metabolism regulation signal transduction histidine kinase
VNLKRRLIAYVAVLHLLMGVVAGFLLYQNRLWLVVVEVVFAASLAAGITLVARTSRAMSAVRQSAQLLDEGELTTRFREVGHPDIDVLAQTYNRMADSLREERVRLREQQYFLGTLLEVSPAGVVILDHDGAIASLNSAARRLLPSDDAPVGIRPARLASPLGEALASTPVGAAKVVSLQGGRRVRCQCASFVERGHSRRFYLIEELTEELRQTEKAAYEKLIRLMSHEVNNSVGVTRSLLQSSLAYGRSLPEDSRREFEHAVDIATGRLERLNSFMRGFAEVVRTPAPRLVPVDVERLLDGCVTLIASQTEGGAVNWKRDHQAEVGTVALDAAQIEQVLLNVLKNAVEAAGPGGAVTVRTGKTGAVPFIEIEDSGPGVPDAVRHQLFTPFFTTKPNGQGIGLTLVQEILRRHEFDFDLDAPEGGPTRFRMGLRRT